MLAGRAHLSPSNGLASGSTNHGDLMPQGIETRHKWD